MSLIRRLTMGLAMVAGLGLALPAAAAAAATPLDAQYKGPAVTAVDDIEGPGWAAPGEGASETDDGIDRVVAGVNYGGPITRANVLRRAKNWYDRNVPYSQSAYAWDINRGKQYRTDCSGFVSMSWALRSSYNTRTLPSVSTRLSSMGALQPGDMINKSASHVVLFEKWANSAHTSAWIYEQANTRDDMNHRVVSVSSLRSQGYVPYKYRNIRA